MDSGQRVSLPAALHRLFTPQSSISATSTSRKLHAGVRPGPSMLMHKTTAHLPVPATRTPAGSRAQSMRRPPWTQPNSAAEGNDAASRLRHTPSHPHLLLRLARRLREAVVAGDGSGVLRHPKRWKVSRAGSGHSTTQRRPTAQAALGCPAHR